MFGPLESGATSYNVPMRRIPKWLYGVVLVGLVVVVLRFLVFPPRPLSVVVAAAAPGTVEETVTNTRAGTVKVRQRAKISPQIGGLVIGLPHRQGSRVAAGDLLLKLEDSVQRAQLELARRTLQASQAQAEEACLAAELAAREWQRGAALAKDGIASPQTLDTLETERDRSAAACRAARAAIDQARANVTLAEAELALAEVRAPFAGVVADLSTEIGEWITPAPPGVPIPAVLDLLDSSTQYVSAPMDEVDSRRVRVGQEVRITVDSLPGRNLPGRLVRVAPFVLDLQEQNRTVEVEAEFSDVADAAGILPGTSADVEIILTRVANVLRIPTVAIAEGNTVLVLAEGRLAERTVETGVRNWQFTEVTSGLAAGDLVVTVRDSPAVKAGVRAVAKDAR